MSESREQEGVRGGAIFLYGDVIYSGGKKFRQALKSHAFQALVPLLFHLADTCPEVVTVESNFSSYHQFLMQALAYLDSPNRRLKLTAMKFIGGILQDYFTDLCFYLKKGDVKTLKKCPVPYLCACPPHHGRLRRSWRTVGSLLQTSRCSRRTRTP
ncbi:uncharacterized protein LOC129626539 isoform X2 [Bubalus kerabau]|uniref:uncharacterized protein LOC129626539 isoform X2 n=1 Tax=Bubalus carabanensis TaxID=3119969 RepID=UPI00244EA653|nr:uncharacterized protein LOC129626539 isoform X2 [Bubalus carabanensis]